MTHQLHQNLSDDHSCETTQTDTRSLSGSISDSGTMPVVPSLIELQKNQPANKRLGGFIGLLCGDAVGVPYEFHLPEELPPQNLIEMTPPSDFNRSHDDVPVGTWSDDGAQALCLCASLAVTMSDRRPFDLNDFAQRLCDWYVEGYLAVDGDVFDIGIQTAAALERILSGTSPHTSGSKEEASNGNGSLMRVLPLVLYSNANDLSLIQDVHLQSLPTHAHARSMVTCAYYSLVARAYLEGADTPWEDAETRIAQVYAAWPVASERLNYLQECQLILSSPFRRHPTGTGYVVDTLWSAKKALEESNYEDVIKAAIALGNDTDTTACVAGGLAGIRHGLGGIPSRWLAQLRGVELVWPYLTMPEIIGDQT